jgi:dihydrofolate reductase
VKLALIVAAAANNVIGCENRLPWHLPQDLKYFKAKTIGKPVIMGRKTYESIGKPLPGRANIVITRQLDWTGPDGVQVAHTLEQAIGIAQQTISSSEVPIDEAMIIGGAEIYRAGLQYADKVYLTRLSKNFSGDAYFPELSAKEWLKVSAIEGDPDSPEPHTFLVFERIDH